MGSTSWLKATGVLVGTVAMVLLLVAPAVADDPQTLLELKERLDRLEKDNAELKRQREAEKNQIAKDAQKKAAELRQIEEEGYEVGKSLGVKGTFTNGQLWFETEDKAFRIHVGGRTQLDYVGVHATKKMMAPFAQAGIGEFDDAFDIRRGRLAVEGTLWEVFDFTCEYDFFSVNRTVPNGNVLPGPVNGTQALNNLAGTVPDRINTPSVPVPTDVWFTWTHLPVIGNVRIGNQKAWFSFEHLTSSRWLDFMERSSAFDAFVDNGNNGFIPGISTFNTYADDRIFLGGGIYKPNFRDVFGTNTGDGEFLYVARIAGNPVYEYDGRCMVHLGLGLWHATADDGVVRYRARTQLRNGNFLIHNIISIIQAQAHDQDQICPEFAMNFGPFNMSAEYYGSWVTQSPGQAFQIVGNQSGATLPSGNRGRLFYQGGYVTMGYFLTGENRSYNKKTKAWDRQAVNENAFLVDGPNGCIFGHGGVEVLARYSCLDLSDKGVNGGIIHAATLGLNWYLSPNAKIQFNYDVGYRDATEYTAGGVVAPGGFTSRDGIFQGAGARLAFDF